MKLNSDNNQIQVQNLKSIIHYQSQKFDKFSLKDDIIILF